MNIGAIVPVVSKRGFEYFGSIAAIGVLSHCFYRQRCFRLAEDGSMFYMVPDPETGRSLKVDDCNCWIEPLNANIPLKGENMIQIPNIYADFREDN